MYYLKYGDLRGFIVYISIRYGYEKRIENLGYLRVILGKFG